MFKHWIPLFYLPQNVKEADKTNSYIHTIATKLTKLMSSRADPDQHLPTHYTSLRWIVAFGEYMFDGNMEWAKKNDPIFGPGSYGHISRLVPEHLFVMEKQLEALGNNRWKNILLFNGYK
jgi:hypothetical protein